jgi:hypothetical protein
LLAEEATMNKPRTYHYDCPQQPAGQEHAMTPMQPLYVREGRSWRRVGSRCPLCGELVPHETD